MATITSPGLGSGLDVNSIVTQLVASDRQPLQQQIDVRRAEVAGQISALGSLKSALSSLRDSLTTLKDGSAFTKRTATSSNTAAFTATADSNAVPGTYSVEVIKLAEAQKLSSTNYTDANTAVGTGTLTLKVGGKTLALTIDDSNKTLAGIRDAINKAADNPGVSATIVTGNDGAHLVLGSTNTGTANAFTVNASGGNGGLSSLIYDPGLGTTNLSVVNPAVNAEVKVEGVSYTSATNSFSGVLNGVTFNLISIPPGTPPKLVVQLDRNGVSNAINGFVTTYNKFVTVGRGLSNYNPQTKTGGPLLGDAALRNISSQLSQRINTPAAAPTASLRSLNDIGISTQSDGTLSVDNNKLTAALADNPNQVANLFSGSEGYGKSLTSLLDSYLSTGGVIEARSQSLDQSNKDLDTRQVNINTRLAAEESRYRKQFTALDSLVSKLRNTGNFLTQQFANLSASSSSK